jgi:diguanylate cyclase (GGDEF)-like protein
LDAPAGYGRHSRAVICEHTFYYAGIAALLLAVPLIAQDAREGHLDTAALGITLLAMFVADTVSLRFSDRRLVRPVVVLCTAAAGFIVMLPLKGLALAYWAFPLILGFHFVLPRRQAFALNTILLVALAAILPGIAEWTETTRVLAATVLSSVFAGVFAFLVDRQLDALEAQLITDPLTRAYNRRHLEMRLGETVHRRRRHGHRASLILFDIDHFKRINDANGHECGDRVLRILVDTVKARIRLTDEIYRYGGEEFVVLLPDTGLEAAAKLAQDITDMIAGVRVIDAGRISVSCGVGELLPEEDADAWLRRCDAALYRAKNEGRGRVCRADAEPAAATPEPSDPPVSFNAG